MKAVIVEDEFVAAQTLQRLLKEVDKNIEIVTVLQSVEDSIEWFDENNAPDLVFMDIHLADGSSFNIFDKTTIHCPVIFTTAYDEYALKAFDVNSIDYLLKPINKKRLEQALEKYKNLSSDHNQSEAIINLLATLDQSKGRYKTHFLIPLRDKLIPISIDKIAYIFAEFKMAKIITFNNETYTIDSSLDELMKQLNPLLFFRANRQYILAHKAIKDISLWFGSKLSVNLIVPVDEKIIVSKARVSEFKKWYTR